MDYAFSTMLHIHFGEFYRPLLEDTLLIVILPRQCRVPPIPPPFRWAPPVFSMRRHDVFIYAVLFSGSVFTALRILYPTNPVNPPCGRPFRVFFPSFPPCSLKRRGLRIPASTSEVYLLSPPHHLGRSFWHLYTSSIFFPTPSLA